MKYIVLSGDDDYYYDNLGFKKINGERDIFDVPEDAIVWRQEWTVNLHKNLGNSWPYGRLLVSKEGRRYVELQLITTKEGKKTTFAPVQVMMACLGEVV